MKKQHTKFNVIIPNGILKKLRAIGKEEGRTVSDLMRDSIVRMIHQKQKEKLETQKQ